MGSLATELEDGEKEVNVLVTGFGVRSPPKYYATLPLRI